MTSVNLMHEAEHSKSVLWDNLEGWDREGDRKGFKMRGHMYTRGSFMSIYGKKPPQYCKVISLQ